jgi:hypothetical protein
MNAGAGTTYIIAGAGEGSTGSTTIVNAAAAAQEIIMDFNPSFDVLQVKNSSGTMPTVSADADGNAVLAVAANHTVTLLGVTPGAVNADWVQMR